MSIKVLSESYKKFRLICQVPLCFFQTSAPGIVKIDESDIILLGKVLTPGFTPSATEASRLEEIIGAHTCPVHGRQSLGLIYQHITTNLATLDGKIEF